MRPFAYECAADLDGAVSAGSASGTMYLAGGTNLVDLMKLGVARPDRLVDVSRLGLDAIEEMPDGGLRIGATVRNSDLAAHEEVRRRYPVLARALLAGASGQIRNMATVAGNLLQRTRCPYFQDVSKPCNKRRPGSGCPAREGEHRNLAILGHSEACVATHPSDMAVALQALDARVQTNARTLPLSELYRLPSEQPQQDTVLGPGELITAVELDRSPEGRQVYLKARERASFAFALVSVAVAPSGHEGRFRIALGGVAPLPWRARLAEEALAGGESFEAAAEVELTQAQPLRDNRFKVPLARNLLIRALEEASA
jgi:xanthine dehydrogenase YagS FAD-binding subunit